MNQKRSEKGSVVTHTGQKREKAVLISGLNKILEATIDTYVDRVMMFDPREPAEVMLEADLNSWLPAKALEIYAERKAARLRHFHPVAKGEITATDLIEEYERFIQENAKGE